MSLKALNIVNILKSILLRSFCFLVNWQALKFEFRGESSIFMDQTKQQDKHMYSGETQHVIVLNLGAYTDKI